MFHSALTRRRAFTTTITTMALTAVFLIGGASTLSAQTTDKTALVGSWLGTVTFPPEFGRPPLKYVGSFYEDGTMVSSDQGSVTLAPPTVFSSFYGVWTHLEQRTFAYTGLELMSDLSGNLVGYLKARGVYTVSQSGNEYSGATHTEVLDADGNVLFSVDVTNTGQRIQVERP
jgi:hypothetical protein